MKAKMRTVASLLIKDGLQIQEVNEWKQTQMLGLVSMTVIRMEHALSLYIFSDHHQLINHQKNTQAFLVESHL